MAEANRKLMRRTERRRALINAASRAFARNGFAATSLEDVAAEAGVARDTIYRNFDTKADLYRAAIQDIRHRLAEAVGEHGIEQNAVDAVIQVARENPDGYRLLFHHAAREPEFRDMVDQRRELMAATAEERFRDAIPDGPRRQWAAHLIPNLIVEAVIAWLDAGCPEPETAADTVRAMVRGTLKAIRQESD
ncbi:MAG TPA: TetR/AcrR family transcriptional regulator [Pseudonocardiaceae bacterium]|jgi:AcrR family transcriptional regulator|nr:TetR/AcrR family transcriptional regulator [Pseudonocardiaceae bacterium]